MNNNSGSYSRSTKMFAASHPVPLGHNINNNHDNRNLSVNNNSDNRSNDNKTWGVPHGSNLNNVTHQNFHSQHQQFHTPGQQRHRNNNVGSERNIDEYNSNGHTFSKTPFGPRGNMVGNPSDHRQNANELGPPNKNTTFHRTPGAAASFPSRGSGSNRGWSSYDGRDQGTSGNNIRQNLNQIGIIGGRSSINILDRNSTSSKVKSSDAGANTLNQQFMEEQNNNLNNLSSWNSDSGLNNDAHNISTFTSTPGTLGSRMRPDNYFPSGIPTTKFSGKRIDNTQSFPPRTPNRHMQDNPIRQTTPFGFGLGSGTDNLPTTYALMHNNPSPRNSPGIDANNSMLSRSSGNNIHSQNYRIENFGRQSNDVSRQHATQGVDIVDLLDKKFSTSPLGGNVLDSMNHNMFMQEIDNSNNGLNPNAPVFNYTPPSPSGSKRFHGNGGVLNLGDNNNKNSATHPSNTRRSNGRESNDNNRVNNMDANLTMGASYNRNAGILNNSFTPNLNAMYEQQQQQQQQQRRQHQRMGHHQQHNIRNSSGNDVLGSPQRIHLSQGQTNGIYHTKRQHSSKTRINNTVNSNRNNKRGNNKKQNGNIVSDAAQRGKKSHHQTNVSPNQQKQHDKKLNSISRQLLKDFYIIFKKKEKEEGPKVAKLLGLKYLGNKNLDVKARAKIYCLLADLEKRDGKFEKAREYFGKVNELDPFAKEGWLEYSKMEEDCGNFGNCRAILQKGLSHDETNENILKSLIKLEEKTGNINAARDIIAKLDDYPISNTWKIILESALMEARAGENSEARQIFEMLMEKVPWSSAVYFEAARFEEKHHCDEKAINIVSRGLIQNSRFGPLWFSAFRLHEKIEVKRALNVFDERKLKGRKNVRLTISLTHTQAVFDKASFDVAKELQWKVSFEKAKMFERAALSFIGHLAKYYNVSSHDTADALSRFDFTDKNYAESLIAKCREAYDLSLQQCQKTLHWKVWLAAARMEVWSRNVDAARNFLSLALNEAPLKSKTQVYLETARLEEFEGQVDEARQLLVIGQERSRKEWKIYLESVLLEMRHNKRQAAIEKAENALLSHPCTGRLWAILIQLKSVEGPKAQFTALERALTKVPKSGEVWCEAARLSLNPTSPFFSLEKARLFLDYAIQFTPQYGDSFLEYIRYILIVYIHDAFLDFVQSQTSLIKDILKSCVLSSEILSIFVSKLNFDKISIQSLNQQCINADPNYGVLWFHCKNHPFDTAQTVFQCAKNYLSNELNSLVILETYCNAFVRRWQEELNTGKGKVTSFGDIDLSENKYSLITGTNFKKNWRDKIVYMDIELSNNNDKIKIGSDNHNTMEKSFLDDFATGLVAVNRLYYTITNEEYSKDQRRKLVYGSDQILV